MSEADGWARQRHTSAELDWRGCDTPLRVEKRAIPHGMHLAESGGVLKLGREGLAFAQSLVIIATVAIVGIVSFGALGGRFEESISARTSSATGSGPPSRSAFRIGSSNEAALAGALQKLAVTGRHLKPAARERFGISGKTTLRAWEQLLREADETHAVLATDLVSAAAHHLDPDQLPRLFDHARERSLAYKTDIVSLDRQTVDRVLSKFGRQHRDRKLNILLDLLDAHVVQHMDHLSEAELANHISALERLAHSRDPAVRVELAERAIPAQILDELATDGDAKVRAEVAANERTSASRLAELARDPVRRVQINASTNRRTPLKPVEDAARSEDPEVVAAVAANQGAPPPLLESLEHHPTEFVRIALATNVSSPSELVWRLYQNDTELVRAAALRSPNLREAELWRVAKQGDRYHRGLVAQNVGAPSELLDYLSRSRSAYLRRRVAGNPETARETLERLASDADEWVRARVAMNPSAREFAESLLKDKDPVVRDEAQKNLADGRQSSYLIEAFDNVAFAMDQGEGVDPTQIRFWSSLPGLDVVPLELASEAGRIDGALLRSSGHGAYRTEVLRVPRVIRDNAEYMGNCTSDFCDLIPSGSHILARLQPEKNGPILNAAWVRSKDGWGLYELKARFNADVDDALLASEVAKLTEVLNGAYI